MDWDLETTTHNHLWGYSGCQLHISQQHTANEANLTPGSTRRHTDPMELLMLFTWRVEAATPTVASLGPSSLKDVEKTEVIQQSVTKMMKIKPYKHIASRECSRMGMTRGGCGITALQGFPKISSRSPSDRAEHRQHSHLMKELDQATRTPFYSIFPMTVLRTYKITVPAINHLRFLSFHRADIRKTRSFIATFF